MKIAIVGGGPGGLYFARLVKRHRPADEVIIIEQNPRDATYGFGVTLGGPARERMKRTDPEVQDKLSAVMLFNDTQNIHLNGDDVLLRYASAGGAIARLELLNILQAACEDVGVELRHGRRIASVSALDGFDLVVGADGVNSAVRGEFSDAFGTRSHFLNNKFAWYGVGRAMVPNALVFRQANGGTFVAHYYAYTPTMSTFVAECDGATWQSCGLNRMSDDERRRMMEDIFAPELAGAKLIDNKSVWRSFNAITNAQWTHRNIALLGDALLSAHFSIGSGTRLAMDDAASLFEAVSGAGDDVASALSRYVAIRRPIRDQFGSAAERSFLWYENVREAMRAPAMDFTYDFLTRTGRVDDVRLKDYAPTFYRQYQDYRSGVASKLREATA
jgi:2-polyprenyl-6-methoxyphenol hydroxylase-like FAD-dependent oxidoreductase